MDRALAAGLPPNALGTLLAARRAWWGEIDWPPPDELSAAISHSAARQVDEMLWRAIRRRLGR